MALDPLTAGFDFGKSIVGLVSEYIEDPDLRAKLTTEIQKQTIDFQKAVLQTQTTPRADAFVKILYATRDVIIPMLRPVGSAALTAFGAYLAYNQIPTPEWLDAVLVAAFPGWMASRHVTKVKEVEKSAEETRLKQIVSARVANDPAYSGESSNPFLDQDRG